MDGGAIPKLPRSNAAQLASPTCRLTALDQDFLLGGSMRGARSSGSKRPKVIAIGDEPSWEDARDIHEE